MRPPLPDPDGTAARPAYEVGLAVAALVFLAAYAWPILQPGLPLGVRAACGTVVGVTWVVFLADYVLRLVAARPRARWFWRHLPDLVVLALPFLRPLQLLRLVVVVRVLNRSFAASLRGRVGLYLVGGSVLVAGTAALAVLDAERGASDASIDSYGDALWWAATTMTTVGYGDTYPVTVTGRFVAVGLMIAGVALLGTVTASIASWLVQSVSDSTSEALVDAAAADAASARREQELGREVAALRTELAALTEMLSQRGG